MKKTILGVLALLPLLGAQQFQVGQHRYVAPSGGGTPALVGTPGQCPSTGTYTATQASHASGNVSVVLYAGNSTGTLSIANTAGYSWTPLFATPYVPTGIGSGWQMQAWEAPTTTYGSTDTATVTSSGSAGCIYFLDVSHVSGFDTVSPTGGNSANGSSSSTNPITTGTFTAGHSSDFLIAFGICYNESLE
jgi:hypothetical protein